MNKLNLKIFAFFKKHKALLYTIIIVLMGLFIYFGTKVQFDEDISKIFPSTQIGSSENLVFEDLKVKDKIFLLFVPKSDSVEMDQMVELCDAFVDSLLIKDTSTQYIDNILSQVDGDLFVNCISYLYENAAVFLDEKDLQQIDLLLNEDSINKQMESNYNTILSASGMAYYDLIRNDPVAFRNVLMYKGEQLRESLGGNYLVYENHFFTPDSTIGLAFLSPNFKSFDSKSGTKLVKNLEKEIAAFQTAHPDMEILMHGAPINSAFNSRQIKQDLVMTLGISIIIVCALIFFCFKNPSTLPLLILPVVLGMFFGLTFIYFFKGSMSLISLGIGAIILGIALSYSIHILTHYKYVTSPKTVIKDQTVPLILSCLTTIGAFMGLFFTESDLLRDFGMFASLTLIGTTIACLIFLPQFLHPLKNKRSKSAFKIVERMTNFPLDQQKWLVISIAILCCICFYTSRWVSFDTNLKNIGYFDANVTRSIKLLSDKTTHGFSTTYYAASSTNLDSAIMANINLEKNLQKLKSDGLIHKYSNISALLIPEAEQQQRIQQWNNFWTPEKKEAVKKMVLQSGNDFHFQAAFFDPFFDMLDKSYTPVSIYDADIIPPAILSNIIEKSGDTYLIFTPVQSKPEDVKTISNLLTPNDNCVVIDPMYYTSNLVQLISNDFNMILLISSIFVFVVLLCAFRSLIIAVVAFLPMFLSWYVVVGIMGIFNLQFNILNIIISTFIFGVGVDYSIFIMNGLLTQKNKNNHLLLYHKTAIFFSAFALIVSISSLIFAKHPAMSSVGLVTLIGMSSTVLITYTLQPFLFRWLQNNKLTGKFIQKKLQ